MLDSDGTSVDDTGTAATGALDTAVALGSSTTFTDPFVVGDVTVVAAAVTGAGVTAATTDGSVEGRVGSAVLPLCCRLRLGDGSLFGAGAADEEEEESDE